MKVELAKWGNSAAIRIPKQILSKLSLAIGDELAIDANEDGCICITPFKSEHRKIAAARGISYRKLFANYQTYDVIDAWPSEDMHGREEEAWQ